MKKLTEEQLEKLQDYINRIRVLNAKEESIFRALSNLKGYIRDLMFSVLRKE